MESIIDNEREEARAIEREPAERPDPRDVRVCPDIAGRDISPVYDPSQPF